MKKFIMAIAILAGISMAAEIGYRRGSSPYQRPSYMGRSRYSPSYEVYRPSKSAPRISYSSKKEEPAKPQY